MMRVDIKALTAYIYLMADIIVVGVVLGTILLWGGAVVFFFGVRKDKKNKFKDGYKKAKGRKTKA